MDDADRREAAELIEALQDDDIQRRLEPGFERDFSNNVIEQWDMKHWLSQAQLDKLREIVRRHQHRSGGGSSSSGGGSRRYEGFSR